MTALEIFLTKLVGASTVTFPANVQGDRRKLEFFLTAAKILEVHKRSIFLTMWDLFAQHPDLPLREIADLVLRTKNESLHVEIPFSDPEKTVVIKGESGKTVLVQLKQGRKKIFERRG